MVLGLAAAVLTLAPAWAAETPTRNGDTVGIATMHADGTITMRLRSVQCNGSIAEGLMKVGRGQADYQSILDHIGGMKTGESKPIPAWPEPPCPKQ
jgi:hypothetical protein